MQLMSMEYPEVDRENKCVTVEFITYGKLFAKFRFDFKNDTMVREGNLRVEIPFETDAKENAFIEAMKSQCEYLVS